MFPEIINYLSDCRHKTVFSSLVCLNQQLINLSDEVIDKIYYNRFEMENEEQIEMHNPRNSLPQRNRFQFVQPREPNIFFNSQFDSGNMHKVVKNTFDHYSIWTASDAQGTDNEGYPKSWFYFQVGGFLNRKVSFSIHRVHFLYAMCKRHHMYRPVYRIKYQNDEVSDWDRLPYPVLNLEINYEEELVLKFDFLFTKLIASVEFAFIYPYSYEQCRSDILQLKNQYDNDRDLLFNQYQLCKSYQGRIIDFLIISSHEGKEGFEVTKGMPFSDQKIVKFRNNKPIIFISARVHPIETPSSFCMTGIIKFLLDKKDMRAYLLRKYFVFVLIPMLNPDGVGRGHCRMDALNQNLNRYYTTPDPQKQPSCYAVKKLCEHYNKDKRLFMYLDLHAHPAFKGNFTFGNAIYQFIEQVQSQMFPKVLSQNCINFEFQQCIFSRKHMKAKDRNEDVSKQGCGRVVFYKEFGLVHSYTLECGYHMNSFDNALEQEKNVQNKYFVRYKLTERGEKLYQPNERLFDNDEKLSKYLEQIASKDDEKVKQFDIFEYSSHNLDTKEDQYYARELPIYNQQTFYNLGRNILISILDIWNKNPYSRLIDMNADRKDIAERQSKLDRFRKEQAGIKTKQKKIVQLIEEQFYAEWHKRNIFTQNTLNQSNQRDKKRYTLQLQKLGTLRQNKSEKTEKIGLKVQDVKDSKAIANSDTMLETQTVHHLKISSLGQDRQQRKIAVNSQNHIENKLYYPRNFKVSRGKQTSSANQGDKEGCRVSSINKDILQNQIKITLQEELIKVQRQEGASISSKMIKNNNFNMNMRVRNVAGNLNGGIGNSLKK